MFACWLLWWVMDAVLLQEFAFAPAAPETVRTRTGVGE